MPGEGGQQSVSALASCVHITKAARRVAAAAMHVLSQVVRGGGRAAPRGGGAGGAGWGEGVRGGGGLQPFEFMSFPLSTGPPPPPRV